jgi:hypothetical protein
MTPLPERSSRPAKPSQESYWEVVLEEEPDAAQNPKPAKAPDYDDFEPPPRPQAVARPGRTKGRRDTSMGVAISGWFSAATFLLFAGGYGAGALGLISQGQVRGFTGVSLALAMIGCGILIIWGTIWLVVVAFREGAMCGLMFLFLPFYPLYYVCTRFADTKGPASMVGVAYFLVIGMAVLGPALARDRGLVAGSDLAASNAARAEHSQQGPPPEFTERLGNAITAIHTRYGNRAVIFVFTGIPTNSDPAQGPTRDGVWEAIKQRIKAIAPPIEAELDFESGGNKALIVAPIDDPKSLASRIRFGKATLLADTKIRIDISPQFLANASKVGKRPAQATNSQPPSAKPAISIPADADPVTKSLLQLKSSDMGQKKEAVHRLERTAPDKRLHEVVTALLPLLNDDDGFLVNDVIKTLMVWRSPAVLPALIQRTNDNRFFVRKEAIKALGKFPDARAVEAIIPHIREDGFEAEAALKEIGPTAEPALIGKLRDGDPHVRRITCEILGQIGGADTIKAMRAIPLDPDLGVRMAANRAAEAIVARVGPVPRTGGSPKAGTKPRF